MSPRKLVIQTSLSCTGLRVVWKQLRFQSFILGRRCLIKHLLEQLLARIKICFSSETPGRKSLTVLMASPGKAGEVHRPKNDGKKYIDYQIKSWRRGCCTLCWEERQTWADLDPMQTRWPCFGWSEAWFADIESPQSQSVIITGWMSHCLPQCCTSVERSRSAARLQAARRYRREFFGEGGLAMVSSACTDLVWILVTIGKFDTMSNTLGYVRRVQDRRGEGYWGEKPGMGR